MLSIGLLVQKIERVLNFFNLAFHISLVWTL